MNEVPAEAPGSPEEALGMLLAGNRRFVDDRPTAYIQDMDLLHARTADHQEPYVAILACADSRVPVGMVFDEHIGRLFVTRIAGSLATSEVIASLEYAAAVLGVKAIVVLGHTNCGAIKAAIRNEEVPGQISALFAGILPAIYLADSTEMTSVTRRHALNQAAILAHASPIIAARIRQGLLKVVAAMYDVATGEVHILQAPAWPASTEVAGV
jgi:carbonic anhydrase